MRLTEVLQEVRIMRFKEAYGGWQKSNLTRIEAAKLLSVCERSCHKILASQKGVFEL